MCYKPKNLPSNKIRALLVEKGVSQVSIARNLGVTQQAVYMVIEGAPSDRIRRAIAAAVGVEVERIWPEAYLTGGPRKRGRPMSRPLTPRPYHRKPSHHDQN